MSRKSAVLMLCAGLALPNFAAAELPFVPALTPDPTLYLNGRSFQVSLTGLNSVILTAPSCRTVEPPAAALFSWKRGPAAGEPPAFDCRCGGGRCRLDTTGILPEFVRATIGKTALKANCFNTALVGAGLASKIGFTPFFEFSGILRERCSREPAPGAGDIGVVSLKGGSLSPIHAFIYLTPEFGYEKPGSDSTEPWRFMNPSEEVGGTGAPYPDESSDLFYFRCR